MLFCSYAVQLLCCSVCAPTTREGRAPRARENLRDRSTRFRALGPNERDRAGYLLLELLVFLALMAVILGLAFSAYYRCADNAKRLQENAADILATVQAGERWRDDIRLARETTIDPDGLKLIQAADTVEYRFEHDAIWRHSAQTGRTICLLSKVKTSTMRPEARRQVSAWRWEVELQSRKAPPYLRPFFTFEAVPTP
jgi:Tfp pilus assembly protein PilE